MGDENTDEFCSDLSDTGISVDETVTRTTGNQHIGREGEWDRDDVVEGWTAEDEHLVTPSESHTGGKIPEGEVPGVCEACESEFPALSAADAMCHYWGVPKAKFEACLDEIENLHSPAARRYFETTALEPGHMDLLSLFAEEQKHHPQQAPPGLIAMVATGYLQRFTTLHDVSIEGLVPDEDIGRAGGSEQGDGTDHDNQ